MNVKKNCMSKKKNMNIIKVKNKNTKVKVLHLFRNRGKTRMSLINYQLITYLMIKHFEPS